MTIYAGDPDANVTYAVTDRYGNNLNFQPMVIVETGDEILGEWLGEVGAERQLRVPLESLPKGTYALRLKVPGDNDAQLSSVTLI